MRLENLIAIDPGETTGWFSWDVRDDLITCNQLPWFEFLLSFEMYLRDYPYATVICESYTITMQTLKKSRQNWSLEAIGVIKYLMGKNRFATPESLVFQSPGETMSFSTRDKLEKLGWWFPGKQHGQDAARHMLKFSVDRGLIELQSLI